MNSSTNRLALVCGSSDGLGLASARAFAEQGHSVILTGRNKNRLETALSSLTPGNHSYFVCDFSDLKTVSELARFAQSQTKPVSILVNNTGGPSPKPLLQSSIEDFEASLRSHLYASHLLSQALVPGMIAQKFGRVINIVSVGAKSPIEMLGVSNTVRGAMINWAKTLALETAKYGVTVNNILPGYTDTNRLKDLATKISADRGIEVDTIRAKWITETPVGRLGTPEEFGALAAFLASDTSGFMTGNSIPLDGGWTRGV